MVGGNHTRPSFAYSYVPAAPRLVQGFASGSTVSTYNAREANRDVLDYKQNTFGGSIISKYDYTVNVMSRRSAVAETGGTYSGSPSSTQCRPLSVVENIVMNLNEPSSAESKLCKTLLAMASLCMLVGLALEYSNKSNMVAYSIGAFFVMLRYLCLWSSRRRRIGDGNIKKSKQ